MKTALFLPGRLPQEVELTENTSEAVAQLLGTAPVLLFPVLSDGHEPCGVSIYSDGSLYDGTNHNPCAESVAQGLLGEWCDFHGRILIVTD